jgi:SAM-dependent methyltransferase
MFFPLRLILVYTFLGKGATVDFIANKRKDRNMFNNELKLFQRSRESIWTDDYISQSLLKAHLDESTDGASRKYSARMKMIDLIHSKAKPQSHILDLGCGPGLYAYELAKLGHTVFGIDFNKASIDYAQNHQHINDFTEYKYANYLKDTIGGTYNLAMMIYCDFGALIPDEQKVLLKKVHDALSDDGIFIFDVFGKNEMEKLENKRSWSMSEGNVFWSDQPYFLMKEQKIFESESVGATRYFLINKIAGMPKEFILWDHYYDDDSIKTLMAENGLETIEIMRGFGSNIEETLLVTARKKK